MKKENLKKIYERKSGVKKNLFFILLVFVILWGCGYTTHSVLPSGQSSIHIDNFTNEIDTTTEVSEKRVYYAYKPGMETDITQEIIDKFVLDGTFEVRSSKEANLLLKGRLVDFRREPLRYDANDNVVEYRISIVVDMELVNLKEEKIVWGEKSFAGESTYRTTGQFSKSESVAIQEAINDLARRVVERTVENW